jgi:L-alanine-DL-glutamate epimerase-like enolase superfamily enzyme
MYADESISTSDDIALFRPYVDGVNVKLEKTGGIREALRAIEKAKKASMKASEFVCVCVCVCVCLCVCVCVCVCACVR